MISLKKRKISPGIVPVSRFFGTHCTQLTPKFSKIAQHQGFSYELCCFSTLDSSECWVWHLWQHLGETGETWMWLNMKSWEQK